MIRIQGQRQSRYAIDSFVWINWKCWCCSFSFRCVWLRLRTHPHERDTHRHWHRDRLDCWLSHTINALVDDDCMAMELVWGSKFRWWRHNRTSLANCVYFVEVRASAVFYSNSNVPALERKGGRMVSIVGVWMHNRTAIDAAESMCNTL